MGVTFVTTVMVVVVIVFFVTVMIVAFIVVVVVVALVVVVMFVVMEGHVECSVFGVNFSVICVFFFISKFDVFEWAFRQCLAQICDEDTFVIEGFMACGHGVNFNGCRCVITERIEG